MKQTQTVESVAYGVCGKGNGEVWITFERHTSLTSGGGMPGQGYPCVLHQRSKNELPRKDRIVDGE